MSQTGWSGINTRPHKFEFEQILHQYNVQEKMRMETILPNTDDLKLLNELTRPDGNWFAWFPQKVKDRECKQKEIIYPDKNATFKMSNMLLPEYMMFGGPKQPDLIDHAGEQRDLYGPFSVNWWPLNFP